MAPPHLWEVPLRPPLPFGIPTKSSGKTTDLKRRNGVRDEFEYFWQLGIDLPDVVVEHISPVPNSATNRSPSTPAAIARLSLAAEEDAWSNGRRRRVGARPGHNDDAPGG